MNDNIIDKADKVITNTYARLPIVIEKGKGCSLWDSSGRRYTDFVGGIAVCSIGHCAPEVINALKKQLQTLFHVSNLYYTKQQVELALLLVNNSFADKVFFSNSGAEANEAAIKLARKYFKDKGEKNRFKIITMERSFHGRTIATLSATGNDKIKKGFEPVLEGFDFVPFNDFEELKAKIDKSTCAVMLEPILGEGGVICPDPGYLKQVRKLCNETKTLLIFDEIQTGIGRTGKLFAYEHFNIEPDIMTLAKALANGLPIGAMLAKEHVASAFTTGAHASTFGGNPVVCSAAIAVINKIKEGDILVNCIKQGRYFKDRLLELKQKHNCIKDVRGKGLILGMQFDFNCAEIVTKCLEKGFLINCIQENILRFVPPLIIKQDNIDALLECLDDILRKR
mmetsp:Transcript_1625/g.1113  ORF Transcript_1625/g.1113 Transcript_1625/m.1113 type:complete len:396 (+) Transcript_1625:2350-3537(+)